MKLLEENIGEKLNDIDLEFKNDFLDMTPKAHATKEKNKLDFSIIHFLCVKEHNKKVKTQSTEWEKIRGYIYMCILALYS